MADENATFPFDLAGERYLIVPQPVRVSLSDGPPALWGLQVHVRRGDELVGVKTCFVGRVTLHVRAPDVLDGPLEHLLPVIHEVVVAKVRTRIEEGEPGDEILFA